MTEPRMTWDDVRRVRDELELKIHLASMEARDRWRELKPRLVELEQALERSGERAGDVIAEQLTEIGKVLRKLRDEVVSSRGADAAKLP